MPSAAVKVGFAPNIETFLESLQDAPLENSVELLIALLKRRQIKHSPDCAKATGFLMRELISRYEWKDVNDLIEHVQQVGRRLSLAQPREKVIANIVRRVLGMIREEVEEDREESSAGSTRPSTPRDDSPSSIAGSPKFDSSFEGMPTLRRIQTSRPAVTASPSMFNLLAMGPDTPSHTPPRSMTDKPIMASILAKRLDYSKAHEELKAEVLVGMGEILDELSQVEDQIANYGREQIAEGEVLFTHSASTTVQKFLLKAAEKRKFTVFHAETFPNENKAVYDILLGKAKTRNNDDPLSKDEFLKPLTAAGIDVIFCKDVETVAVMCRVHKVILSPSIVLANGGLVAAAGARLVALAAKAHSVPVIVLSGVYKLSPEHPHNPQSLIEYGDPSKVLSHRHPLAKRVEVVNPLTDYVAPELVDLYITNLGPCALSYLYRIIEDHYNPADIKFNQQDLTI